MAGNVPYSLRESTLLDSEDSYIELAVNLGQNLSSCQKYTTHILQKMQRPSFLDSRSFGKQVENLI
jgi:predicted O-linked N-acetylglucosamine transferase (SPINDLY family)